MSFSKVIIRNNNMKSLKKAKKGKKKRPPLWINPDFSPGKYNEPSLSIEYSRPGCYVGFTHCHHGRCHNDTTVCVCADNLCNDEKFSSEAPPVTPGSGLYCYQEDYHHHHPPGDEERWQWDWEECDKGEDFCIEITNDRNDNSSQEVHFRGCWSTEYEGGRYNFTGCEVKFITSCSPL